MVSMLAAAEWLWELREREGRETGGREGESKREGGIDGGRGTDGEEIGMKGRRDGGRVREDGREG